MICENCGKEHDGSFGSGRFCCRSCANTRKHSEETKQKISTGVHKSNKVNHKIEEYLKNPSYCKVCNKLLGYANVSGYCKECLLHAPELADYRKEHSKYAVKCVKNHKSWMPRNQTSYAEKFWITVLNNNNIKYEHDYTVYIDSKHWYFLDFYIEKNNKVVDLEIDGKQHEYKDRKEHDIRRDIYLKSKGYLVYRIPWNEINSENGKLLMKSKIDNFLDFYNNL